VSNNVGYFDKSPCRITLPAGRYFIKARAQGYLLAAVPVLVEPGRTTRVHLDANWKPPPGTSKSELIYSSNGYPIGWRTDDTKARL